MFVAWILQVSSHACNRRTLAQNGNGIVHEHMHSHCICMKSLHIELPLFVWGLPSPICVHGLSSNFQSMSRLEATRTLSLQLNFVDHSSAKLKLYSTCPDMAIQPYTALYSSIQGNGFTDVEAYRKVVRHTANLRVISTI